VPFMLQPGYEEKDDEPEVIAVNSVFEMHRTGCSLRRTPWRRFERHGRDQVYLDRPADLQRGGERGSRAHGGVGSATAIRQRQRAETKNTCKLESVASPPSDRIGGTRF
jgi:hypothetical protein